MTSEIRLAFEHPDARSKAGAPEIADRISLRDHIVEVDIGAFQQERGKTQRVCFNIVVEVRPLSEVCLLYTSPSPRDKRQSRMPSSA